MSALRCYFTLVTFCEKHFSCGVLQDWSNNRDLDMFRSDRWRYLVPKTFSLVLKNKSSNKLKKKQT